MAGPHQPFGLPDSDLPHQKYMYVCMYVYVCNFIHRFQSRGQQLCKLLGIKKVLKCEKSSIGQLHDDVILLQLPESLSVLFSCAN